MHKYLLIIGLFMLSFLFYKITGSRNFSQQTKFWGVANSRNKPDIAESQILATNQISGSRKFSQQARFRGVANSRNKSDIGESQLLATTRYRGVANSRNKPDIGESQILPTNQISRSRKFSNKTKYRGVANSRNKPDIGSRKLSQQTIKFLRRPQRPLQCNNGHRDVTLTPRFQRCPL
jgi:hypothetical protein